MKEFQDIQYIKTRDKKEGLALLKRLLKIKNITQANLEAHWHEVKISDENDAKDYIVAKNKEAKKKPVEKKVSSDQQAEEKKEEEIKKKRPSVRERIFTMIPIIFLAYVVVERIKRKREKRNCEGKRKRNRNQKRKCKHYRRKKRKRKKGGRQKRKMQKTAKREKQMRNASSFDVFSGGSSKTSGVCRNRNRKYRNLY